jgi:hypothetical protein
MAEGFDEAVAGLAAGIFFRVALGPGADDVRDRGRAGAFFAAVCFFIRAANFFAALIVGQAFMCLRPCSSRQSA